MLRSHRRSLHDKTPRVGVRQRCLSYLLIFLCGGIICGSLAAPVAALPMSPGAGFSTTPSSGNWPGLPQGFGGWDQSLSWNAPMGSFWNEYSPYGSAYGAGYINPLGNSYGVPYASDYGASNPIPYSQTYSNSYGASYSPTNNWNSGNSYRNQTSSYDPYSIWGSTNQGESATKRLNVPLYAQSEYNFCAPAAVSMILAYFGIMTNQYTLASAMNTRGDFGTSYVDYVNVMNSYLSQYGFQSYRAAYTLDMSVDAYKERIAKNIDAGFPVLLVVNTAYLYPGEEGWEHAVVCVGYQRNAQGKVSTIYYNDSINSHCALHSVDPSIAWSSAHSVTEPYIIIAQ